MFFSNTWPLLFFIKYLFGTVVPPDELDMQTPRARFLLRFSLD